MAEKADHWTLDKRVPIALVGTILIQTFSIGYFVASLTSRVTALEASDVRMIAERDVRRKAVDDKMELLYRDRDRLVRVETQIEGIAKTLGRIETKLDQVRP
jgi:hypothetical protein